MSTCRMLFPVVSIFLLAMTAVPTLARAERERDTIDRAIASPDESTTRPTARTAGAHAPVWTTVVSAKLAIKGKAVGSAVAVSRVLPVTDFDVEVSVSGSGRDLTNRDGRAGDVGASIAIARARKGAPWSREIGVEPGITVSNGGSVSGALPFPIKAHHQARGNVATKVTVGLEPSLTFADDVGWEVAPSAGLRRLVGGGWAVGVGARGAVSAPSFDDSPRWAAKLESKVTYAAAGERTFTGLVQFGPSDVSAAADSLTLTVKALATF